MKIYTFLLIKLMFHTRAMRLIPRMGHRFSNCEQTTHDMSHKRNSKRLLLFTFINS